MYKTFIIIINLKPIGEQQQQNAALSFTGVPQEEEESKQLGFFLSRGERKKEMGAAGGFVIFLAKFCFLFFSWRAESLWVCWFVKCVSWMWQVLLAPVKDVSIEGCDSDWWSSIKTKRKRIKKKFIAASQRGRTLKFPPPWTWHHCGLVLWHWGLYESLCFVSLLVLIFLRMFHLKPR